MLDKIYYIVLALWPPDAESQLNVKGPDVIKIKAKRRRRQQRMRWLDINSVADSRDMNLSKFRDILED